MGRKTDMTRWREIAKFWVDGEPLPCPRPRARAMRAAGKWIAQVYHDPKNDGWKQRVYLKAVAIKPAAPLDCPVRVDLEFRLPRPGYMLKPKSPAGVVPCMVKPDRDNLDKFVLDAMTEADWWTDDGRVCCGMVSKVYHPKGEGPGVWVRVCVPDEAGAVLFPDLKQSA